MELLKVQASEDRTSKSWELIKPFIVENFSSE